MGDALAFCPPMIITPAQVDDVVAATKLSLDTVLATLK
jgi:4-aminobutyrate--pyruvate transaminase